MVQYLETKAEFDAFLKNNADKLVVIDFTANWCGPCKRIAPVFQKMSEEFPDVAFAKVDVDENSETAEYAKIEAMPTFNFYKGGEKPIAQVKGADEAGLRSTIETHK